MRRESNPVRVRLPWSLTHIILMKQIVPRKNRYELLRPGGAPLFHKTTDRIHILRVIAGFADERPGTERHRAPGIVFVPGGTEYHNRGILSGTALKKFVTIQSWKVKIEN